MEARSMRQRKPIVVAGAVLLSVIGVFAWHSSSVVSAQTTARTTAASASTDEVVNGLGGPTGVVKTAAGQPIGGLMVQLISQRTAIRTTVFSNDAGRYEFPKLDTGEYTLRLARPIVYKAFTKEGVRVDGPTRLQDIVVERVTNSQFLPPTVDIMTQLSSAELLDNIPGPMPAKRAFVRTCGGSCHGMDYPARVVLDSKGWDNLMHRMVGYGQRVLLQPYPNYRRRAGSDEVLEWLSDVRTPDSPPHPPMKPFPGPTGRARNAIITEYELPFAMVNIHDVYGDPEGNVWFSINRSPFIGKLDPESGKVTTYRTPKPPPMEIGTRETYPRTDPPGVHPGWHWIQVDPNTGTVWFSDTWAEALGRLDPKTNEIQIVNTGQHGNMALSRDGKSLWKVADQEFKRYDAATVMQTGLPVKTYPLATVNGTYGTCVAWDDSAVGGGGVYLDVATGKTTEFDELSPWANKSRCDFDPDGNLWVGSKHGPLLKFDPKTGISSEYNPEVPFGTSYGARSDKNGDIWLGLMHTGRVGRFDAKSEQWTEYVLPSPYSFDFFSWVDNSTDPVTYWYGDQFGYIVRVQPLD